MGQKQSTMEELSEDKEQFVQIDCSIIKEKWEMTIDVMMIIGKYFESSQDYVNVMKVKKRYEELTKMYHFNPISEWELFENMETQYLYDRSVINKENMIQYVYWYKVNRKLEENEVMKTIVP